MPQYFTVLTLQLNLAKQANYHWLAMHCEIIITKQLASTITQCKGNLGRLKIDRKWEKKVFHSVEYGGLSIIMT